MDDSPKNREIEKLKGDAPAIHRRGQQIQDLGEKMKDSAALLKQLHDGADGQKGLAVEKLRGKVTDVYGDLDKAGDRYTPTGPALKTYATALADVQPLVSTAVDDCVELWATYESKAGAASDLNPLGINLPDDDGKNGGKSSAEKYKDATGAADTAHDAWETAARRFDHHYDTWEAAFDKAADDIGDVTHGNITDGFWDKVDGIVSIILKVLTYVGLALAILAIIIGGPIIGAIAAIVAVVSLALTIYQKIRGDAEWKDVILAAVAVIPVGKLGVLFKSGSKFANFAKFAKESPLNLVKNFKTLSGEFSLIKNAGATGFLRGGGGLSGLWRGARGAVLQMNKEGTVNFLNVGLRTMVGLSTKELSKLGNPAGAFEIVWTQMNNLKGLWDNSKTAADIF